MNPESTIRRVRPAPSALLSALAALTCLLAGCGGESAGDSVSPGSDEVDDDDSAGEGGGAPDVPPEAAMCTAAAECVAVSSTCCQCPSFAVAAGLDFDDGCSQIECDGEIECPDVEPACIDSQCQLVCSPVPTAKVCAVGFARDDFGCLLDACREDPPSELFACAGDGDCTQVQADCCGCELGGADTAVASAFVDQYLDSLGCSPDPPCPDVNVCDASLVPRCIAQSCTLAPPDGGGGSEDDGGGEGSAAEGELCGVPGHAMCPPGQECILNHPDAIDATRIGVGTCRDA